MDNHSSDPFVFNSMDKTNGKDLFATHEITHHHNTVIYRFQQEKDGYLDQERVMIAGPNEIQYVVFDMDCNGNKAAGMQYSLSLDENNQIMDYSVRRYDKNKQNFTATLPKHELEQVNIPATALMIDNFGSLLNGMNENEKTMLQILNNGKNIAMTSLTKCTPVKQTHGLHAA